MTLSDAPHFSTIDISKIKFGPATTKKYRGGGGDYIAIPIKYPGMDYFTFRTGKYDIQGYKLAVNKNNSSSGSDKFRLVVPLEDTTEEQTLFKKFLADFDAAFVEYCTNEQIYDDAQAYAGKSPYRKGVLVNQPQAKKEGSNVKVDVAKPRLYASCTEPNAALGVNGKAPPPTEFIDIGKTIMPWSIVQKCNLTGYLIFGANRATVTISSSGVGVDLKGMIITAAKVATRGSRLSGLVDELYADRNAALAEAAKLRKQLKEELAAADAAAEAAAAMESDNPADPADAEVYVPMPEGITESLFREIEEMSRQ